MQDISNRHGFPYNFDPIQLMAQIHLIVKGILRELEHIGEDIAVLRKAEDDLRKTMDKIYEIRNLSNSNRNLSTYSISLQSDSQF